MEKIIIAIDGPSASGKSTLAKDLAQKLHYAYVDSGAMYRAVTLYFLQHHIPLDDAEAIENALLDIDIQFKREDRGNRTILNGQDVEDAIRQMEVSRYVSQVAAIPAVRAAMVKLQQAMGQRKAIVMDGRDIGTVVFPHAELKIFVTAAIAERAQRRYKELSKKGVSITLDQVLQNLNERDLIDSTRTVGPLRKAEDAFEIDNTNLDPTAQLQCAITLLEKKLSLQSR